MNHANLAIAIAETAQMLKSPAWVSPGATVGTVKAPVARAGLAAVGANQAAVGAQAAALIAEQPELVEFFENLKQAAPHLVEEAQAADLANIHRMGVACRLCGQFELAEKFYGKAMQIAEASFGVSSVEAATQRNFLAGLYMTWHRYADCRRLLEVSLASYHGHFGADHIYTRLTHFALALAYLGIGDMAASKREYGASALQKPSGAEAQSRDRWSVLSDKLAALAAIKYEQGHYDEALELFRHCVIHEANEAWPGNLVLARALSGLAVLCRSQGLNSEALECYKMTVQMKKDLLGEAHPDYLITFKQYKELQREQDRYSKSLL